MAYGDFTYTPPVNQTVISECWAAGGVGRIGQVPIPGCGGGGGAYARTAGIALLASTPYAVRVGAPGGIVDDHESSFVDNATCMASPGTNAAFETNGTGGQAAASTGDVKFSGGNGGTFPGEISSPGTGGGSSAGRASNGNNGATPAGGAAPAGGGAGGAGGPVGNSPGGDGTAGFGPGGGGGGGGAATTTQSEPGFGAEGAVVIWLDMGVWPPFGQTPLAVFGTPPANPVSVKTRKSATFM